MPFEPQTILADYFVTLEDSDIKGSKSHLCIDILSIAIRAAICGADVWGGIKIYSQVERNALPGQYLGHNESE